MTRLKKKYKTSKRKQHDINNYELKPKPIKAKAN